MGTIAQTGLKNTSHESSTTTHHVATNSEFWNKVESIRFGLIPLLFILIPCLAGIAASTALSADNMVMFVIAGAPAMIVETLILGMATMRSVVISSAVSCIISMIIIAINYLA